MRRKKIRLSLMKKRTTNARTIRNSRLGMNRTNPVPSVASGCEEQGREAVAERPGPGEQQQDVVDIHVAGRQGDDGRDPRTAFCTAFHSCSPRMMSIVWNWTSWTLVRYRASTSARTRRRDAAA
jgi:hypothetical protein